MAKPVSRRRVEHRGLMDFTKMVAFPITVGQPGVKRNIVDDEE